ncbi:glycosyltransferase family 4 protein [Fischerella sp. JS2]|uniref:glycosyltransferase family 4 protein n=1 Tax=Fischerella sp. JS2 TaxID=2597771 RepID=UPI0028F0C242|nr:glycosyltransferase family 4 protein [Fischerella sp. JS2]
MHILTIHNYYQIRGGEDECHEAEVRLLRERGHHVEVHEENNDHMAALSNFSKVTKTIWSQETYQTLKHLLKEQPYDVVHVQNFFPLISPSVYYAAKAEGVPVVQTLHNYRLLCPNALFFRNGNICEDCLGQVIPYPGVLHGCYRNSQVASGGVATMLAVHWAINTWTKMVDIYIALTEFARQKFIAGGLPAEKIVVKPNFVSPEPAVGNGSGGYALYVGRLSVEKGIDTLLKAWEHLSPQIPLKIVGDGPLAEQVVEAAKRHSGVEWLGRKPMSQVHDLMGEARFLVFPSKWYETFGRVAVEAFAKGTPVIAANIGAIAELVDSGRTGLHFRPGDPDDLTAKVEWMLANPVKLASMRQEARAEFEAKYTAEQNYQKLMEIYTKMQKLVPNNKLRHH